MTVLLRIRGFPMFTINIVYTAHGPCPALWLYVDSVGLWMFGGCGCTGLSGTAHAGMRKKPIDRL